MAPQPSGGGARTGGAAARSTLCADLVEEDQSDSDFDLERAADRYAETETFAKFYGADAHWLYD